MERVLISSAHTWTRLAKAREWLRSRAPAEEVLLVAATADAGSELLREVAAEVGAAFGWHRTTLGRLAGELARPTLVEEGLVPIGALGVEALVARVIHELRASEELGRYRAVATTPGFARAAARTIHEVRLARAETGELASAAPELVRILRTYEELLGQMKLADRALVFELAERSVEEQHAAHPLVGLPTLLLDVALSNQAEEILIAALVGRASDVFATVPAGDEDARGRLERAGFASDNGPGAVEPERSLAQLRAYLFEKGTPPARALDESVVLLSAPGESRECVEIARQLLASARSGVPFDRMAVLLRSVEEYRPHLEAAFARAGIPAHFAQGTVRPGSGRPGFPGAARMCWREALRAQLRGIPVARASSGRHGRRSAAGRATSGRSLGCSRRGTGLPSCGRGSPSAGTFRECEERGHRSRP